MCQQQFSNQMELKAHTRQNHEIEQNSNDETEESTAKETDSNFRCDICGMVENSVESLQEHIVQHDNQFKCVICGTILKHKANLFLHMRIHVSLSFILISLYHESLVNMTKKKQYISFRRLTRSSTSVTNATRLLYIDHRFECICKPRILMCGRSNAPNVPYDLKQHHS